MGILATGRGSWWVSTSPAMMILVPSVPGLKLMPKQPGRVDAEELDVEIHRAGDITDRHLA